MTSDRPYRAGLPHEEALSRLRAGSGSQWDAAVVGAALHLIERGDYERIADELYSVAV
jgi:HD-GYP domain-containing protein (c-di-GMP phosphodiesterase class II)